MRSSPLLSRFFMVCALIGAGIGTLRQVFRITQQPQQFRSIAKLVAGWKPNFSDNVHWREQQLDFYGTIIETLESAEMRRRTLERVKALNPDLKISDVEIHVVRSKGTSLFNLLATGPDPKITRIFLDALVDEYFAFREQMRSRADGRLFPQFIQEIAAKQKILEETWVHLEQAREMVDTLEARAEQQRLAARLIRLRDQRGELALQVKALNADEGAKLQAQLGPIEQEIQTIEAGLQKYKDAAAELQGADHKYQTAKMAYEALLNTVETYQVRYPSNADYVAIVERASPATEYLEDWRLPIAAGAGGGGFLGGLVGLLLSLIIVRAPKPSQVPSAG